MQFHRFCAYYNDCLVLGHGPGHGPEPKLVSILGPVISLVPTLVNNNKQPEMQETPDALDAVHANLFSL